jgi:16S rRNA (cytosine967-C5)-methyltransferase
LVEELRPLLTDGDAPLAELVRMPSLCTRLRPGEVAPIGPDILRTVGDLVWWRDPLPALKDWVLPGRAAVQDPSQREALLLAEPRPGELVLDVCAAPGGKTRLLVELGARVVAAELDRGKARELAQAGLAPVLVMDGRRPALRSGFDLVVVDAPCSNSGVLGRRPEAKWRYRDPHLAELHQLQDALLAAASDLVRPGGRLLYATCSLTPAENEERTARLRGWRVARFHRAWPGSWSAGACASLLVRA